MALSVRDSVILSLHHSRCQSTTTVYHHRHDNFPTWHHAIGGSGNNKNNCYVGPGVPPSPWRRKKEIGVFVAFKGQINVCPRTAHVGCPSPPISHVSIIWTGPSPDSHLHHTHIHQTPPPPTCPLGFGHVGKKIAPIFWFSPQKSWEVS